MSEANDESKPKKDWWSITGEFAPIVVVIGLVLGGGASLVSGFFSASTVGQSKRLITGPDDPIAIAIGHAEGTRTCDGNKTKAYSEHRDPGDGKLNGGTFSSAPRGNGITADMTPEQRDTAYIKTLNNHIAALPRSLSPTELATYADLTVQAHPDVGRQFAKTTQGNIIDRRVESFVFDGKLEAVGFGNSKTRLRADQQRRQARIDECLKK